jgi:hypothetical protein
MQFGETSVGSIRVSEPIALTPCRVMLDRAACSVPLYHEAGVSLEDEEGLCCSFSSSVIEGRNHERARTRRICPETRVLDGSSKRDSCGWVGGRTIATPRIRLALRVSRKFHVDGMKESPLGGILYDASSRFESYGIDPQPLPLADRKGGEYTAWGALLLHIHNHPVLVA